MGSYYGLKVAVRDRTVLRKDRSVAIKETRKS